MANWWQKATDSIGLTNYQDVEAAKNAIGDNKDLANETYSNNQALIKQLLNSANSTYGNGAAQYDDRLANLENVGTYQAQNYSYDKDENDFLSPARNMRTQQAMNAIQNSRANAGGMFSSDTMNEMNNKAQLMASEEWDKAYDRMMKDRDTSLNEWKANAEEQRQAYTSSYNQAKDLLNLANSDRTNLNNASQAYYTNLINNNNANMSTQAGINNSLANAGLQQQGLGQQLFKILGSAAVNSLL